MNKNIIGAALLSLAGLLACNASAQHLSDDKVPAVVKASFTEQFPKAEHAKWEMESKTEYEVNFKQEGKALSATYGTDGAWLETEHAIKADALPELVRKAIAAGYADHKVKGIDVAESSKGTVYEVDMEKGEQSLEVVFAADGKVLESKVEEHKRDEDDEKGEEND